MARRGENIRKRKDGRWEARMTVLLPDGKKRMHSFYGKTYQEAKEKRISRRTEDLLPKEYIRMGNAAALGEAAETRPQWEKIAEEWLGTVKETKKYSTYIKYRDVYGRYLGRYWQKCLAEQETGGTVIKGILEEYADYSDSTRKSIMRVIRGIRSYGIEKYKLTVPEIKYEHLKKERRDKMPVLSEKEQKLLWHYLTDNREKNLLGIVVCLSTGLRLGEICALKWKDIDFERGILSVNSTVQRIAEDGHRTKTVLLETEPKTPCSKREIPLPDMLLGLLRQSRGENIYVTGGNTAMEPRTYQNIWKKCLKEAGISYRNFHSLRHTFATNCVSRGMDVKSLSEILGHADVKTTLNKYVHPSMETKRTQINTVYLYTSGQ